MRIFGRVCGFVAGALLILQAIGVFLGYSLHGVAFGIELIALAVGCITDAFVYFKKPKHPFLRIKFCYNDGLQFERVVRADRPFDVKEDLRLLRQIAITTFESEKDEAVYESSIAGRCN